MFLAEILHQFFKDLLNWSECIHFPLCSLSRCSVVKKPPAELQAGLMAQSLMAHTSVLLPLRLDSLKCTRVADKEEHYKPSATLPLFPLIVSSVQLMSKSISIGLRKGSAGSLTPSHTRDVSTIKAVTRTVATEPSKE